MSSNQSAYLVLVAAPSATGPPLLPVGAGPVPALGTVWTLQAGKNLLGRPPTQGVAVVLPWHSVSRRHAEIEWFVPGNWEIEDLQSRNGTSVNGQQLQPRSLLPLNDGDRIQIGSSRDIELLFCFQLNRPDSPPIVYDGGALEGPEQ